jgi:ribose 5-phosphate isomerase B
MKIGIGSDHGGFAVKEEVVRFLRDFGHEIEDAGCFGTDSVDYPDFADKVCELVGKKTCERGILICGTGIGMSMAANKNQNKNIRAALCHDSYTARMSRVHNDANILCIGARVLGIAVILDLVGIWVETEFERGRHQRRIDLFSR